MKSKAFFLFYFLLFIGISNAQLTNWKNYTDMKNVRSLSTSGSRIWAATSGGAFVYDTENGTYQKFHKADGFSGSQLTATAVDNQGRIWFGSSTGRIDVYDPQTNSTTAILDIFNSLKQQKSINDIIISDNTVYIASDFGISLVDPSSLLFLDTYTRFGTLNSNLRVNNVIKTNRIIAALDNGVAVQKPGASNLSSPDAWDVFTVIYNGSARVVRHVAEFNGQIIAASELGVFILQGNTFVPFVLEGTSTSKLRVIDDVLYITSGFSLFKYDGQVSLVVATDRTLNDVIEMSGIYAASSNGIIRIDEGMEIIKPNAPFANQFADMVVDSKGNLWSATGRDGQGVYFFDGDQWVIYNLSTYPEIITNAYFNAYTSGDEVYFGSWGSGFLRVRNEEKQSFNVSNTPLRGTQKDPNFVVIGGIAKDSRDNLWILNYETVTRENLSVLTPDSVWYNFKVPSMQDLILFENFDLHIDPNNTKWFFSRSPVRPGVFYFNENNTFDNTNDDRSGYVSGLNDNVLSMAIDKRGDVWIGTGFGVNVITNASAASSVSNAQLRVSSVFALRQHSINAIAVDPLNRKWIGTNQGLLLVNADGSALLASYDSRNTPLLSDEIRSIVVDENSGIVYVGTDAGLTSFETIAKRPVDSFTELSIYPNPLRINGSFNGNVTIDGLIKDTDIKILTITGKLVKQFSSPGGRVAHWDGRNSEGEFVNSGIYLIIASDREGDNVQTAKIAVLKE
jgi:ligand-binding sensor domain-containing protein